MGIYENRLITSILSKKTSLKKALTIFHTLKFDVV